MVLSFDTLSKNVVEAKYAVRGEIVQLAQELADKGQEMVFMNIGNPQELGQKPLTYAREIMAMLHYPQLLEKKEISSLFSQDNIDRARIILKKNPLGLGAYTQSAGIPFVKQAVADFISTRDNIPTDAKNIFLTDGASKGVDMVLQTFITNHKDGVMIPIPQYPLYSADIRLFGGSQINYYLDEEKNWTLNMEFMQNAYESAIKEGITPKVLVVINPSNPTGSLLPESDIKEVIGFAEQNNLAIVADEVYQENIYYEGDKFVSFAKIASEKKLDVPLFSLHSTSKGFIGECGYRGGYIEFRNIPKDIMQVFLKLRSIGLCSNTSGQIMTYLMVQPPKKGEISYESYINEKNNILGSLGRKAKALSEGLNKIDGVECQKPRAAMYLFPKLELPEKDYNGKPADFAFCKALVEQAGIVTVPGSGFGQRPGTHHLRMTFLPPEESVPVVLDKFENVYRNFVS